MDGWETLSFCDTACCGTCLSSDIIVTLHKPGMSKQDEPLFFETEIEGISEIWFGQERNIVAWVNVEGVERVCRVPPDIFQVGEKVRISV